MADHIPFINTKTDATIAAKYYADSVAMRVTVDVQEKYPNALPGGPKRWIDPAVDGLHHDSITEAYAAYVSQYPGYDRIRDSSFQEKPDKKIVKAFVYAVLDRCAAQPQVDWITVPQLPFTEDTSRNKLNKLLAENTKVWKQDRGYSGKLILPFVFTNQKQYLLAVERKKRLTSGLSCFTSAGADGVWVADSDLSDQKGIGTFDERFQKLRKIHEELNEQLQDHSVTIAGPYWGMNFVMWARGLVRYTAVGLGNSYQYYIPGRVQLPGSKRIALGPLRRLAVVGPPLRKWLADAAAKLPAGDPAATEFLALEKDFSKWQVEANGRLQAAEFYKGWFDKISTLPPAGRALGLYQDLSSAYVLGTTLKDLPLPPVENTARKPARVAQQFMLNCL